MPAAAAVMIIAVDQPRILVNGPFVLFPIIFLLFDTSMMMTINGGASTPLITAVQKSAVTGGIFRTVISAPIKVEAAMIK